MVVVKNKVGRWLVLAVVAIVLLLVQDVWCSPKSREGVRSDAHIIIEERGELVVEVADTSSERRRGLSGLDDVPWGTGMLFYWEMDTTTSFWMADTYVPLSIAFIDADWEIMQIVQMPEPMSEESVIASAPYRYALEVPYGWFDEHGVVVGDRIVYEE